MAEAALQQRLAVENGVNLLCKRAERRHPIELIMSQCDIFVPFAVEHGKRKSLQENLKGHMVFVDIDVVERFVYEMNVLQQINMVFIPSCLRRC